MCDDTKLDVEYFENEILKLNKIIARKNKQIKILKNIDVLKHLILKNMETHKETVGDYYNVRNIKQKDYYVTNLDGVNDFIYEILENFELYSKESLGHIVGWIDKETHVVNFL